MKRKQEKQPDLTMPDLTSGGSSAPSIDGDEISVVAYSPVVRPLGQASGGGFRLSVDISDTGWNAVKDLNSLTWQNVPFTVILRRLRP